MVGASARRLEFKAFSQRRCDPFLLACANACHAREGGFLVGERSSVAREEGFLVREGSFRVREGSFLTREEGFVVS